MAGALLPVSMAVAAAEASGVVILGGQVENDSLSSAGGGVSVLRNVDVEFRDRDKYRWVAAGGMA